MTFEFRGKSGVVHKVDCRDARIARIVKQCRDLPGYELFQYVDEAGERRGVESSDVNDYVRAACGEAFTAKDVAFTVSRALLNTRKNPQSAQH